LRANIDSTSDNESEIIRFLTETKFECFVESNIVKFKINDVHLSPEELRSKEINANVARYASICPAVDDFCRKCALEVLNLKEFSEHNGIIAEGRTCGMYLFPDADIKFWFMAPDTANIDFRLNVEREADDPVERDRIDFTRTFYPIIKSKEAIEVWTSSRTIEENIDLVAAFIEQKLDVKRHAK
jgi:cytidylate kinase